MSHSGIARPTGQLSDLSDRPTSGRCLHRQTGHRRHLLLSVIFCVVRDGDLYKGMRTGGKILRVTVSSYTQEHQRALHRRCVSLLLPPYEEAHGRLLFGLWEKGFCLTPCVTMGCPRLMIVIVPTRHLFPNKTSIRMSRTYNSGAISAVMVCII